MNYKKLELKLREMVERRLEEGFFFQPAHASIDRRGAMCLIGAIGLERATPLDEEGFVNIFGVRGAAEDLIADDDIYMALECGFEGFKSCSNTPAYAIGARIRRDYCEWE